MRGGSPAELWALHSCGRAVDVGKIMLDLITEPVSWAAGWNHILPNHACSLDPPESTDTLRLWAWWDAELGSTFPCPSMVASYCTQISLLNTSCALKQVRGQQTGRGLLSIRNYLGHPNLTLLDSQFPFKYFWLCILRVLLKPSSRQSWFPW